MLRYDTKRIITSETITIWVNNKSTTNVVPTEVNTNNIPFDIISLHLLNEVWGGWPCALVILWTTSPALHAQFFCGWFGRTSISSPAVIICTAAILSTIIATINRKRTCAQCHNALKVVEVQSIYGCIERNEFSVSYWFAFAWYIQLCLMDDVIVDEMRQEFEVNECDNSGDFTQIRITIDFYYFSFKIRVHKLFRWIIRFVSIRFVRFIVRFVAAQSYEMNGKMKYVVFVANQGRNWRFVMNKRWNQSVSSSGLDALGKKRW